MSFRVEFLFDDGHARRAGLTGVSRSATIVIAYLMWRFRMSFDEAYKKVLKSRRVSPNEGFISQLKCFEKMDFTYDPSSEAYKEFQSQYVHVGAQIHMSSPLLPAYYSCRLCRPCDEGELFTEYLEWMNNHTSEIQGKLYCTRCFAKLGSYNWCGERCTCGKWITPAFHFSRKHLDEIRTPTLTMTTATQRLGTATKVDETVGSS
ncbi:Dual specificity protein phosphatase 12 [Taenia crassiceps]|uniref:Dual specificity protein phosphatase 12 n=1 Tax=Taenia crassiceps TaxID=6207 RepID=A0ABR4QEK2_9CEST